MPHEITVRYWAGARAAAGVDQDLVPATTVAEALAAATALHPGLAQVLPACSVLLDGRAVGREASVRGTRLLEVLPPFAGG